MESKKVNINQMYTYITSGHTLYDLLSKYTGLEDFSSKSIVNEFRRSLNLQQDALRDTAKFKGLVTTYNKSIHGKIVDSMLKNMTFGERKELLEKLQAVNPELYNFPGLEQYIGFLEDSNFNPRSLVQNGDVEAPPVLNQDIDELNRILIDTAMDKADPELVTGIRNSLIHVMLIPIVKSQILKANPERDFSKNEELAQIELLSKIYCRPQTIEEYDKAIQYAKEQERMALEQAQLATECRFKRIIAMSELTGKSVSEISQAVDKGDGSLVKMLARPTSSGKEQYTPKEGDYYWGFMPDRKPDVILDEPIEFSENGSENQSISMISYGNFLYGMRAGNSKFDESPLELVGITIFGRDDNINYFMVTPSTNIKNLKNGKNSEYYKKVLLSRFLLDDTLNTRGRYLPEIVLDEDGHASLEYEKEVTIMNLQGAEAVQYARVFPGNIGRGNQPCTLDELCNSQKMFEMQMRIVHDLHFRDKKKESSVRGEYE